MKEQPDINWTGASGKQYTYYIWELPGDFSDNQNGKYIYSRRNKNKKWVPIYIGQGDLRDRTENHHQADCIMIKGATHVHAHLNSRKEDRLAEESDLLANYPNAYQPVGCNERKGG